MSKVIPLSFGIFLIIEKVFGEHIYIEYEFKHKIYGIPTIDKDTHKLYLKRGKLFARNLFSGVSD